MVTTFRKRERSREALGKRKRRLLGRGRQVHSQLG
jgi:hypothetical protein